MTTLELLRKVIDAVQRNGIQYASDQYFFMMFVLPQGDVKTLMASEGGYISHEKNPHMKETIFVNPWHTTASDSYREISLLFHELSHATGASTRLNRKSYIDCHKDEVSYIKDELVAETSSFKLIQHFGIETPVLKEHNQRYITMYERELTTALGFYDKVEDTIKEIQKDAEAAKDYILKNWLNDIIVEKEAA